MRLRTLCWLLEAELDRLAPMLGGALVLALSDQQLSVRGTPHQFALPPGSRLVRKGCRRTGSTAGTRAPDEPPKADSVLRVTSLI